MTEWIRASAEYQAALARWLELEVGYPASVVADNLLAFAAEAIRADGHLLEVPEQGTGRLLCFAGVAALEPVTGDAILVPAASRLGYVRLSDEEGARAAAAALRPRGAVAFDAGGGRFEGFAVTAEGARPLSFDRGRVPSGRALGFQVEPDTRKAVGE